MVQYRFYCVICGEEFHAQKSHARVCSATCRVALSNVTKNPIIDEDGEELSDAEKEEAAEKTKEVIGESTPPSRILKKLIGSGKKQK